MGSWKLHWISLLTQNLYPVVDKRGCSEFYKPYRTLIWINSADEEKKKKKMLAATVNALVQGGTLSLEIGFKASQSSEEFSRDETAIRRGEFKLQVQALTSDKSWKEIGSKADLDNSYLDDDKGIYVFSLRDVRLKQLVSPSRAVDEPWAYVGNLSFQLTIGSSLNGVGRNMAFEGYPVEIYAICPGLPKFLRHEGIPQTLLRFALSPYNTQVGNDLNVPYLEAITKRVFNSGFKYERSGGGSAFTDGAGEVFQLDKFLQIWDVLNGTASEEIKKLYEKRGYRQSPPTVNCYDQAGILGICVSFACKDEYDRNTLIAYFMKPFGFLHDQPLVGWGKCNNPFYTFEKNVFLDDPQSRSRTKFGNHVFLMFRERIYDACAGPYIGGKLSEYITACIDSEEGRYPPKFWATGANSQDWTLEKYDQIRHTGGWQSARAYKPSDNHGGILGEIENMLHTGRWDVTPEHLDEKLDELTFKPNISDLGDELIAKTASSKSCKVTWVSPRENYTGAGDISDDPSQNGEFNWALVVNDSAAKEQDVTVRIHKFPSFKTAATEHVAMYASGSLFNGPDESKLLNDQCVSGDIGGKSHATALISQYLIDCASVGLKKDPLLDLLKSIIKVSTEGPQREMKVGNKSANGWNSKGEWDPSRCTVIPIKEKTGEGFYAVQVSNCLDIDWSYTTGAVFLKNYAIYASKGEHVPVFSLNKDAGKETMDKIYYFNFARRDSGGDRVKLVFYDRHYDPTVRYLDFRLLPS